MEAKIFGVMPIGKSKRIKDKAFVKFKDKFLFIHGYEILSKIFPTFIVCHPELEIKVREILNKYNNIIIDTLNIGPLGALYTAAKNLKCDYIFFVGCDMPFLNINVIKFMCKQIDNDVSGVVLKGERFEPLHAIYKREFVLENAEKMIKNNERKISDIIEKNKEKFKIIDINNQKLKEFDPEIKFLNDIDTAYELKRYENAKF